MADITTLRYRSRDVVFEKSARLVAVRARAGMADAMEADIAAIAISGTPKRQAIGAFEVIELRRSRARAEQDLDWLRARPSVAAASHVFRIRGENALLVPNGHIHLQFHTALSGPDQQTVLTRYRLQAVEHRGNGDFLVRITSGSKNPITTAAALQTEHDVLLAEPEFVAAD